jgi:toxin FitB
MSGYLIDTNVLSEFNKVGGKPDTGVQQWLEATPRNRQFVSVITLAEIRKGIGLLAEGKRRENLQQWLTSELEDWFSERILPIDRSVADRWALLLIDCYAKGRPLPSIDSLSAATALTHDLVMVTRNVKDFEGTGVRTLDPWKAA